MGLQKEFRKLKLETDYMKSEIDKAEQEIAQIQKVYMKRTPNHRRKEKLNQLSNKRELKRDLVQFNDLYNNYDGNFERLNEKTLKTLELAKIQYKAKMEKLEEISKELKGGE
ncbi:hypothetical protein GIY11_01490 [Aerococcaceae bacterium DSM 109653]|uniref:Uncharacterized protein n=1 Tax=Fundicoccus ignavus TaxID=2664442 RepID=A0A844BW53_9LACT|nr:hypothetical protein [Fundicoccus ignavus]MRI80706.1 hypothetical protein [Fundicoccus ignavus]